MHATCAATTRSGKPCSNPPVTGATVCRMHGGSAPQVKSAAKHRAAVMEAHAEAERMVARAGVEADPIEHLMDSLYRVAALADVYGRMVAELDEGAQRDMAETDRDTRGELGYHLLRDEDGHEDGVSVASGDRLLGLDRHGAAQLHPFVVEYHRLLEQRAKLAKLAIDAGVQERQVQIAEQVGQTIARVIEGTLADLGVEQTPEVGRVVRRHLELVKAS